jgi:hypothetical protein
MSDDLIHMFKKLDEAVIIIECVDTMEYDNTIECADTISRNASTMKWADKIECATPETCIQSME